jgi:NADPH-dependent 2,4-dienoyl-CoA reductase/sulfur reductase-like enzyme
VRAVALRTIAVVGASLAGVRAAETLRAEGFDGRLILIGGEAHQPYDRPPLSKEILRGEWEPARISLRPGGYQDLALELRLGRRARSLDLAGRRLALEDDAFVEFDGLVIATGASPRTLEGADRLGNVFVLRTLDDAVALRAALERGPRVAVVGAGFIGAEVAASCRARGLGVTVVEPLPVPLERALGRELGAEIARIHREEGVDLRCGVGVAALEGERVVRGLRLADGTRVPADVVVIGIGVSPETGWLAGSGLALDDGVLCDASCAAAPHVVAAGDVARWPNALFDETMRIEHWTHAVEQGVHAARRLLHGAQAAGPFTPVPLFWSDQYDVKIQLAGRPSAGDEVRVVHGDPGARRCVALYGRDGWLVAALALNRSRRLVAWRRRIAERMTWAAALERAKSEA